MSVSDGDCEGYGSGEILAYESGSESDGYVDDEEVQQVLKKAEEAKAVLRSFKRKRLAMGSSDESDAEGAPPGFDSETVPSLPAKRKPSHAGSTKPDFRQPKLRGIVKTPSRTVTGSSSTRVGSSSTKDRPTFGGKTPASVRSTPLSTTTPQSDATEVISVLKEISNTLNKVVTRLDKQDSRIHSMEKKLSERKSSSPSSTSSSQAETPSRKVSPLIRSEVRSMYRTLIDEDNDFQGYSTNLGTSFKDEVNVKVTDKIIREVKSANPVFQSGLIRAAAYTYYRSLCQESSLERRGVKNSRDKKRRRRERVVRKLNSRIAVLKKSTLSEKDKTKWIDILVPGFISSDYSCSDSEDDVLVTQTLDWRSSKVTKFFYQLDQHAEDTKSAQAKKQTKQRVQSDTPSVRAMPSGKFPSWAMTVQSS